MPRKFLRFFPSGFTDETYLDWERSYKADAHQRWCAELNRSSFRALLEADDVGEIASRAIRIESKTNLLCSFEKMAPSRHDLQRDVLKNGTVRRGGKNYRSTIH
jgi:hypothetical protein